LIRAADTPGGTVADRMIEGLVRLFSQVTAPHVDMTVPAEAGHRRPIGAVATIR
jgi:hypothetical protein